jgi:hypothetical protein
MFLQTFGSSVILLSAPKTCSSKLSLSLSLSLVCVCLFTCIWIEGIKHWLWDPTPHNDRCQFSHDKKIKAIGRSLSPFMVPHEVKIKQWVPLSLWSLSLSLMHLDSKTAKECTVRVIIIIVRKLCINSTVFRCNMFPGIKEIHWTYTRERKRKRKRISQPPRCLKPCGKWSTDSIWWPETFIISLPTRSLLIVLRWKKYYD